MDEGEAMVSSDDLPTSNDRTDYAVPVDLEERPSKYDNDLNSNTKEVPEYATINTDKTSRLRQHDPPSYPFPRGDPSSSRMIAEDDDQDKEDSVPEDDIGRSRSREEEDKIEVLGTLLDDEPKRQGSNGYPPGVGWTIGIAGAAQGKGDKDIDAVDKAMNNSKILKQFEEKQQNKDECLVDCLYYTTTCCECVIL